MAFPTTNLVAYYKLDESSGNASDSFGSNTLTNNGTTAFASALINNGADYGTANSTKYFKVLNNLGIDGGAITISTWVKMRTEIGSAKQAIVLQGSVTSQVNYIVYYDYNAGTRRLTFNRQRQAISNNETSGNTTLGTTTWHHIVLTYDGTNLKGWLDGTQIASSLSTSGNGSVAAVSQLYLGFEDQQTGGYLSAYQDETGVWSRALSSTEITDLYNGGAGLTYSTSTDVTVSPSVKTSTFSIPAYTVTAERFVTVTPTVPSATFTIPSPTTSGGAGVSPAVKTATFSIPAYSVTADGAVTENPSAQVCTFTIPSYTVTAISNIDVSPSVQVLTFTIPVHTETVVSNITISPSVFSMLFSIPTYTALGDYWEDKFAVPATSWSDKNSVPSTSWGNKY